MKKTVLTILAVLTLNVFMGETKTVDNEANCYFVKNEMSEIVKVCEQTNKPNIELYQTKPNCGPRCW